MKKEIIINYAISETRIAILENNRLVELFVERPENERTVGDIYLGKVVNVVKGIRAAFVDIGQPQDAFLHFSDVGDTFSTIRSLSCWRWLSFVVCDSPEKSNRGLRG